MRFLLPVFAIGSAAFGAAGVSPTETPQLVTEKFLVVVAPGQADSDVMLNLAMAGYPSTERIPGLPARYGNYRLVQVSSANASEKANLLAVPGVAAVRPVYQVNSKQGPYPVLPTGQLVARFAPGTPVSAVTDAAALAGCTLSHEISGLPRAYVFDVDESKNDPYEAANKMAAVGGVLYAHASVLFRLEKHAVGEPILDPLYPFQWHLHNTAQLEDGLVGEDINAENAWLITKGENAIVAEIDDCLQKDHEDLKDNYLTGFDFVDQDDDPSPHYGPDWNPPPPFPPDPRGDFHGTCVAGIIAARDNTIGVRGVAPRAKLVGCKIGLGMYYTSDQDVANAFLFAEANGAMAVNNSWGGPGMAIIPMVPNTQVDYYAKNVVADAIREVSTNGRGGRGMLVLFSAGNDSMLLDFGNAWAGMKHSMAISATMRDGELACYSNYGPDCSVSAPGGGVMNGCYDSDITTTDVTETPGVTIRGTTTWPCRGINPKMKFLTVLYDTDFGLCPDPTDYFCTPLVPDTTVTDFENTNYTHHMNGTSSACPVTTGVAALVFSVNPNLTAKDVRNLIEHTAKKVQSPSEHFDAVTGHNDHYGHGRVDAYAAASAALAGMSWPSPVTEIQNVSSQALARIFWKDPDWDDNGTEDADVAGVLVVRGALGSLEWAPKDGTSYIVGQLVAPGVMVVANDKITTLDEPALSQGQYEYAIFVRNAANYYSWGRRTSFSSTGSVNVPLASMQASVTSGPAPLAVHFSGGGIDAGGITSVSWNFGDGATGTGVAVDHTYTASGKYTAILTVKNAAGQSAQTTTVIEVLQGTNALPSVSISASPETGQAPLVVVFRGSATDSDGTISRYQWDFGDGSTASGMVVEHIYLTPGTYGVTLTVTDNAGGQGTAFVLVSVTAGTTTAADIVGQTAPAGLCGSGVSSAAIASLLGLCGLMALRRRG